MKKYNTPEIMISLFNVEEVLTDSAGFKLEETGKGNTVSVHNMREIADANNWNIEW